MDTNVLDYERMKLPAYKLRSDVTEYVIHLTRRTDKQTAFEVLKDILKYGYLKFQLSIRPLTNIREPDGTFTKMEYSINATTTSPVVCFTEQTLISLSEFFDHHERYNKLEPYGIAFHKNALFAYGGRPVIYGDYEFNNSLKDLSSYIIKTKIVPQIAEVVTNHFDIEDIRGIKLYIKRKNLERQYLERLKKSLGKTSLPVTLNSYYLDTDMKTLFTELSDMDRELSKEELHLLELEGLSEIIEFLVKSRKLDKSFKEMEQMKEKVLRLKLKDPVKSKLFEIWKCFSQVKYLLERIIPLHQKYFPNRMSKPEKRKYYKNDPLDFTHEREWRCPKTNSPEGYPQDGMPILLPRWKNYPDADERVSRYPDNYRKFKILVKERKEVDELRIYIQNLSGVYLPDYKEYYNEYSRKLKNAPVVSIEEIKNGLSKTDKERGKYVKFDNL